jgi:hypothetical protein
LRIGVMSLSTSESKPIDVVTEHKIAGRQA